MQIVYRNTAELIPYANNPRNNDKAVDAVAASIRDFGFKIPIVVDSDGVIVAGHTRLKAAQKLGLESVPVIVADDLTEDQVKAFRLADNKTAELAEWDFETLEKELDEIKIDMSDFGFDFKGDWFSERKRNDTDRQEGNDEYNEFLDKFEIKKTTDDCYTPDKVYEAVVAWVEDEYKVDRKNFVRPFYPGGDYQNEKYKESDIVVDNPPFSIISQIIEFYMEHNIKFFLFAPHLTLFSSSSSSCCVVGVGVAVTYENGAIVESSFVTNLETLAARSAPSLYEVIKAAVDDIKKESIVELPKYIYPDNVLTATNLDKFSKYGVEFSIPRESACFIRRLDSQKDFGKSIFGAGLLISEKAAAEKAAAEKAAAEKAAAEKAAATRWELSEREIEIIKSLK